MEALLAGAVWAGLVGWLLLRLLRQFRTHRDASLGTLPVDGKQLPSVVIIVPARNEIGNIRTCLSGLTAQRGLAGGAKFAFIWAHLERERESFSERIKRLANRFEYWATTC